MRRPLLRRATVVACVAAVALVTPLTTAAKTPGGCTTAEGMVFYPNPVVTTGNTGLKDLKDADQAVLTNARRSVTLVGLDGSGYLTGRWATVKSETGNPAFEPDCTFDYNRHDDRFEQVMAYYWATQAQLYLQELGFRNVNNEPQRMKINQYGVDNSYFNGDQKDDLLRFGKGGVDDAEDAEVILHEYGHAIQDSQVPGFGSTPDAGAIGEGFGDYWAQAVSSRYAPTPDEPCIADWDSVTYTAGPVHCLRRTDGTKTYPADLAGEVHADGEIWSSALNSVRTALGATKADTAIIKAQFSFTADISMPNAAKVTIATVKALYGNSAANAATAAFHARGLA